MEKFPFRLFCISSLLILSFAFEIDGETSQKRKAYDIHGLLTDSVGRLVALKSLSPSSINDLRFGGGQDFDFKVLETPSDLSLNLSRCSADIFYTLLSLNQTWALHMLDSFGKPESGILQGNFKFIGDYNECINVRSSNPNAAVGNFKGKYCSMGFSLEINNTKVPFPLAFGTCVPDSCSSDDIEHVQNLTQIAIGNIAVINGTNFTLTCKSTERPLNASAQVVIGLLSIFCLLAVLGSSLTVLEYAKKMIAEDSRRSSLIINVSENGIGDPTSPKKGTESDDVSLVRDNESDENDSLTKLKAFFRCFCVFTNGAKLLNTDSSEGQLLCIHGIRFFSMSWVILGHTYAFLFTETRNMVEAFGQINTFAFQVVLQGFYSVDSFFVLSGFLLTFLSMKEFSKTKGFINWPYFYIHRFVRLTPIYMMVLAFSATAYLYLGSGPFWSDFDVDPNCRENWWWNLLYINNFTKMDKICMGWSWYLANDMQFFVISPLFLIALWQRPKVGYGLIATFLGACWLANFFITYHFKLPAGMSVMLTSPSDMMSAMTKYLVYFDKIYTKPYTRISPYLIGMLVGYLLFKRKTSDKPKHSLAFLSIGWIIASTITLVSVYGMYHKQPDLIASCFFNALHRTTFALGLGWVIYACLVGQGGVVNSILSYKLFIPLSRLTFTAYLIHPMIITGYFTSLKTVFQFSHSSVVFLYLGFMLTAYGLSLPVALILESPIVALEKLMRTGFGKKKGI